MSLSRQRQSRLEEAKVEKRQEDEDYLARHPEIGAAIRVISRVGSSKLNYLIRHIMHGNMFLLIVWLWAGAAAAPARAAAEPRGGRGAGHQVRGEGRQGEGEDPQQVNSGQ